MGKEKKYRTKAQAGDVADIPSYLPVITNRKYQNSISLTEDKTAYLQPIHSAESLVFANGKLLFEGLPMTAARLRRISTNNGIENIDLPLLRVFYGIILERFSQSICKGNYVEEVVTIYYPDFARRIGKSSNISRSDVEALIGSILRFHTILGVTEKGKEILPVLLYIREDRQNNTISFSSPYMTRVIMDVYDASIKRDRMGLPVMKQNGLPLTAPAYTYLIRSSLAKERNHKAAEIVVIIVRLIEIAGNSTPHIRASTIVDRNCLLSECLNKTERASDKNKVLKRSFAKAFELLITQTRLQEVYADIQLPDPNDADFQIRFIPTMSTLSTIVYEFPHKGKKRSKNAEVGELP